MKTRADAKAESIRRMLNPRSIAVVGATERMQYGGRFLKSALGAGERVSVYPVNPRYDELLGVKCYPSLRDVPEPPDLVGIIVPYDRVIGVLEECVEVGARSAIIISAGFAERGDEGRSDLQAQISAIAESSGVRVCGPNCLGLANVKDDIWASSSSLDEIGATGPVALISQSGASAFGPFLARAGDAGVGYSYIISTGNEADLDAADFIQFLADDADTRVIVCSIEGIKEGRKFLEAARLAGQRGKPIVVMKTGRSEAGARAALSHTAALTGSDTVHDAAFAQHGVIRVEDYDELLETAQLLAHSPSPDPEGVGVISHSGGISSLIADKCGQMGLELPPLTKEAHAEINEVLQGFGWVANPADVTGNAFRDSFYRILQAMIGEPEVGTLVVASSGGDGQADQVIGVRDDSGKAVAFLWTGSQFETDGLHRLKQASVPVFYQPDGLARALRRRLDYQRWRDRQAKAISGAVGSPVDRQAVDGLLLSEHGTLTEHEAKRLLSLYDIPVTLEHRATTAEEAAAAAAEIGYPVVIKVESPDILHKTEADIVKTGIGSEQELRRAYDEVMSNASLHQPDARIHGVLVQEMVVGGIETIVGVSRDPTFGPVLLFGMGGVQAELYGDVSMRVCPIDGNDARDMIGEVKGARLLEGYRGSPAADVDALVDVLLKASTLAMDLEEQVAQLDVNPLAVLPRGEGVKALDALAVLRA